MLTNCYIKSGENNLSEALFTVEDGIVTCNLNGYAIIPLEEYAELTGEDLSEMIERARRAKAEMDNPIYGVWLHEFPQPGVHDGGGAWLEINNEPYYTLEKRAALMLVFVRPTTQYREVFLAIIMPDGSPNILEEETKAARDAYTERFGK